PSGLERTPSAAPAKTGRWVAARAGRGTARPRSEIHAAYERPDAVLGGHSDSSGRWARAAPPADDAARSFTFAGWRRLVCGLEAVAVCCFRCRGAVGVALASIRPWLDPFDRRADGRHRTDCGGPIRYSSARQPR